MIAVIIKQLSDAGTRAKAVKALAAIWDNLSDEAKLDIANAVMKKAKGMADE